MNGPKQPTAIVHIPELVRRLFALAREVDRVRYMPDDEWVQLVRETWHTIDYVTRLTAECAEVMSAVGDSRASDLMDQLRNTLEEVHGGQTKRNRQQEH